ncbi:MAG: SUMF1/EgtB/PvdO family nonheme iron enzyme, partial [Desulfosarcina sp.]
HAEQLSDGKGAVLAARYGALSADHLEYLAADGAAAMADAGTVAVLLPGAFYFLKETRRPPVELLRRKGVPMAVATDCNPGTSPTTSPLLMMNMACVNFGLTPAEALAGFTVNAARALGIQQRAGTLEVGKQADFAVWEIESPAELAYRLGGNPCRMTVRAGKPVAHAALYRDLEADDRSDHSPRIGSGEVKSAPAGLPNGEGVYTEPTTGIAFVFVPGGTYSMGDTFDQGVEDEKPVHEVRVSAFYLAIHPVTQAQWKRLMPENPARWVDDDRPVEQVTLSDVTAFLDRLNAAAPEGLHFDLPSEAQWEYAARSGGKEDLYAGGQEPRVLAWTDENSGGRTAPVGLKQPNGLGIFDMSGNVWEWCRDLYQADAYLSHPAVDPVADRVGRDRVIRGGSWNLDAWSARCSRRFHFDPELFGPALGFRVVMEIAEK